MGILRFAEKGEVRLVRNELKWLWLADKLGVASTELLLLVEKFGDIDEIYNADYDRYCGAGISERLCEKLCDKKVETVRRTVSFCESAGVGILTFDSYDYPASLRSLKNPPAVLYYMGRLPDFNKNLCISIVGTRTMSEYGMRAAYKIAYEVAASGAIVVSGMALGIDGIASCAAVAARGTTVAVLGCGIDVVYPKEHIKLKEIIKQNGAVITEFPPASEPRGMHFPIRNRIISGISQGTVVVDADLSSGAMITAKNAILQGRDIYAVPGNIDVDNFSGTNSLIRDGAQAVLCGNDIIKNYVYIYRERLNIQKMLSAQKHSDFNAETVANMGVGVRVSAGRRAESGNVGKKAETTHRSDVPTVNKTEAKATASLADVSIANIEKAHKKITEYNDKAEKTEKNEAKQSATDVNEAKKGDNSRSVLEKLSEKQRRVFDEMPLDRAVTVDYLAKAGIPFGEVISALTVLEIKGLVSSLPGALYIRK